MPIKQLAQILRRNQTRTYILVTIVFQYIIEQGFLLRLDLTGIETQIGEKMNRIKTHIALAVVLVAAIILSGCGPTATPPPPTPDLDAYATQVAATVLAQVSKTAAAYVPPATNTPEATVTPRETATPEVTATPTTLAACDQAKYVSDVTVPDGTQMTPGQKFVKTWQIKNTGTCTWSTSYTLIYGYGEKMSGKAVALTGSVPPAGTTEVSVNLTAPSKAGTYTAAWRMANAKGYPFGDFYTVVITVK
jgi:hypothetical protein